MGSQAHPMSLHTDTVNAPTQERTSVDQTQVPFGLSGDRMVSVTEVAAGLACGCICPACYTPLVARKGDIRVHHFAHRPGNPPCMNGAETAIHRMAKQLLAEHLRITLPRLACEDSATDSDGITHTESELVCDISRVSLDAAGVERDYMGIRPDVIAWIDGREILIEVTVRNPVSRAKRDHVRGAGLACMEIDLSKEASAEMTLEKLTELVVDGHAKKRWISHPQWPDVSSRVRARLIDRIDAANELARARRRASRPPSNPLAPEERRPITPPNFSLDAPKNRWLVCESCRTVHNIGPYSDTRTIAHLECTACGHFVGLDPPRPRY